MESLRSADLSRALINASRKEATSLKVPFDLETVPWERLDYLGLSDPKSPQRAYVFVPVDQQVIGAILRVTPASRNQALCSWCEDVTETTGVRMFTAKRAGAAGRAGNTVGTLLHADFSCSQHVRRKPTSFEGKHDPDRFMADRITALKLHAEQFMRRVSTQV